MWRIRSNSCTPGLLIVISATLIVGALLLSACGGGPQTPVVQAANVGDPQQGQQAIIRYGCISCHTIPGVTGAYGNVGPPLNNWASRKYIAGMLPNEPNNLIYWIQNPQAVVPGNVMPNLGVSRSDAQNIAAYLYTLR